MLSVMKNIAPIAFAAALALPLLPAPAVIGIGVADAASPREDIAINGDRVYLGDLFDGLDAGQAETPIARSPAPGREVVLDRRWVAQLMQAHGITLDDGAGGLPQMTVRRESITITGDAILEALRLELSSQDSIPFGDRLEVTLDRTPENIHLTDDADANIEIRDLSLDRSSGRFSGNAVLAGNDRDHATIPVSGRARSMITIPVLSTRVGRRTVITANDLDWVEVDAMRLDSAVIHDASSIVGMTPRRGIVPNTPIRDHDLAAPIIVSRGDRITMIVRHGSLALSAQGRALEDGARGQTIRVMNIDSNQTVEGVVDASGQVRVLAGSGAS